MCVCVIFKAFEDLKAASGELLVLFVLDSFSIWASFSTRFGGNTEAFDRHRLYRQWCPTQRGVK